MVVPEKILSEMLEKMLLVESTSITKLEEAIALAKKIKEKTKSVDSNQIDREIQNAETALKQLHKDISEGFLQKTIAEKEEDVKKKLEEEGATEAEGGKPYTKEILEPIGRFLDVTTKSQYEEKYEFKAKISGGPKKTYTVYWQVWKIERDRRTGHVVPVPASRPLRDSVVRKSGEESLIMINLSSIFDGQSKGLKQGKYEFILKSDVESNQYDSNDENSVVTVLVREDFNAAEPLPENVTSGSPTSSSSVQKKIISPAKIEVEQGKNKSFSIVGVVSGPDDSYDHNWFLAEKEGDKFRIHNPPLEIERAVKKGVKKSVSINFAKLKVGSDIITLPAGEYVIVLMTGPNDRNIEAWIPVTITQKNQSSKIKKEKKELEEVENEVSKFKKENGIANKDEWIKWHKNNTADRLLKIERKLNKLLESHKDQISQNEYYKRLYEKGNEDIADLKEILLQWKEGETKSSLRRGLSKKLDRKKVATYDDLFKVIKELEDLIIRLEGTNPVVSGVAPGVSVVGNNNTIIVQSPGAEDDNKSSSVDKRPAFMRQVAEELRKKKE